MTPAHLSTWLQTELDELEAWWRTVRLACRAIGIDRELAAALRYHDELAGVEVPRLKRLNDAQLAELFARRTDVDRAMLERLVQQLNRSHSQRES